MVVVVVLVVEGVVLVVEGVCICDRCESFRRSPLPLYHAQPLKFLKINPKLNP